VITRIDQARPAVIYALLILLMAAVFVPMSRYRLVDGDEGTYILDSRLVMEGQMLFHDLFWPQMFLTPYIFGAWMLIFGNSWYGARFFASLAAIALGLVLYRQVRHLTGRQAWGVLAVVVFSFSSLEFGWLPLIKTFPFGTLTLFGAYAVLTLSRSPNRWFYSGFLLGLAIDIRLYVVFVVPAFLVELYLDEWHDFRKRMMEVARFAVGLVLALLPNQFFLMVEPETFIFNIITNHATRSPWGFFGFLQQKSDTALQLLTIKSAEGVASFQFALLFFVSLASWVSCALARRRLPLSSMIFIPLALASLVPTPTYTQYFSMTVPFLIVDAVVFIASLPAEVAAVPALRRLLAVLVAVYVLVSPFDFYRWTLGGENVPGISFHPDAPNWKISTIRKISAAIDREVPRDNPVVICFWPGYLAETRARIYPKMTNHFTIDFSLSMTDREIRKFNFMSYPELVGNLEHHTVDVVVLANWVMNRQWVRDHVVRTGYVLASRVENAEIYKFPADRRTARGPGN
jgi:hypothetical protein